MQDTAYVFLLFCTNFSQEKLVLEKTFEVSIVHYTDLKFQ